MSTPSASNETFDPSRDSPYNYVPTAWICALFIVLFSLTGLIHLGQSLWYKMYFLIPTIVTCALCEVLGWSGRYWSSQNPLASTPFMIQITSTIIAPSFMTAAMFIILGRIMTIVGVEYSRLRPKTFSILFVTADIVALAIQGAGGGIASSAEDDDPHGAERGAQIMVAGIIIQMVAVSLYVLLAIEYLVRVYRNQPIHPGFTAIDSVEMLAPRQPRPRGFAIVTQKIRLMIIGLSISTVFIYIRSIYRTIELLDGWNGSIISNERLFNLLDGATMVVAMVVLNAFHPGFLLHEPEGIRRRSRVVQTQG